MRTTAKLHVHPKVKDSIRVFEVRHLAAIAGCAFVISKPKLQPQRSQSPADSNDGGHAA